MRVLKAAFKNLKTTTLRTFLAMLGILVGTASVVAMVSIGQMATEAALAQFKTLGTNLLALNLNTRDKGKMALTLKDALSLQKASPEIDLLAPYQNIYAPMTYRGKQVEGTILGVTQSLADIVHLHMLAGRFISNLDKYELYCVLGYDVYKSLNMPTEKILGSRITLSNTRFVIIGIADKWPENAFFNQNINMSVLIPILSTLYIEASSNDINSLIIRLKPDATDLATIKDQIEKYMSKLNPDKQIFFRSAEELVKSMAAQHVIFVLLLSMIASISLLVGGIGVMNIMLMTVMERRREIGIRLAIGAHRSDIQAMFLAESVLMSVVGGLLGVAIGIIASLIVAKVANWSLEIFILPPLIGFSSSVLIGIFFGFFPAYKASKLDPIETLRSE